MALSKQPQIRHVQSKSTSNLNTSQMASSLPSTNSDNMTGLTFSHEYPTISASTQGVVGKQTIATSYITGLLNNTLYMTLM